MKKHLLFAYCICILLSSNNLFSQETAFEKGTIVATGGYGFPDLYRTSLRVNYNSYNSRTVSGIGPLILKGDYGIVKFKWGHSVGAGIVIGYSSTKVKYSYSNSYWSNNTFYNQTDAYKTITIGARGTYHFFTKEKFDCYASVGLGFNINTYSRSSNDPNGALVVSSTGRSGVYESFTVGIRYFFNKNIGVYSELGWDMSAPIQAGIALKF